MGALLTLYLASAHPEIAGIVVYSPALMIANHWAIRLANVLQFVVKQVNKPNNEPSDADARWQGYEVNPVPALAQVGKLQNKVRTRLPRIEQPMLIAQGRLDKSIDLRSGEIILREVASKTKELRWLENSTHCLILDCEWERAAEMTLNFIQKLEKGRL
jgi:carboxylesterase